MTSIALGLIEPDVQVEQALAAGFTFPVMTTSDGRPLLKYSDLLQRDAAAAADPFMEDNQAAAPVARLRAERLSALNAQTATAAPSSASAPAHKAADESDDEAFLHTIAVGKLPDHLRRSDSQDSDSDLLVSRQEADEQQAAEPAHRPQQDVRIDHQTALKSL